MKKICDPQDHISHLSPLSTSRALVRAIQVRRVDPAGKPRDVGGGGILGLKKLFLMALFCSVATASVALEIEMPPETAVYRTSNLPGYQLVQKNCIVCHSAQYVLTQPPTSTRQYWTDTVHKMEKTFGAPIPQEDMPAMIDYLVKVYGNEQPMAKK
jgi:hypothetical protein